MRVSAKKLSDGGSISPISWEIVGEGSCASVTAPGGVTAAPIEAVQRDAVGVQGGPQPARGPRRRGVSAGFMTRFAAVEGQAAERAFKEGVLFIVAGGLAAQGVEEGLIALHRPVMRWMPSTLTRSAASVETLEPMP